MTKLLYNQTLVKACQIDYEDGPIDPQCTLIHTRAWHFENLQKNLKHKAIVCMSMGDCGLEFIDNNYTIGRYFERIYQFNQFNENIIKLYCPHNATNYGEGVPCGVMFAPDGINHSRLLKAEQTIIPKTKLCFVKFHTGNHPMRPHIFDMFKYKTWATVEPIDQIDTGTFFQKMKQHKFVVCPRGHGPDCYRTWEALYMGCIPIVPSDKIGGCHHHFRGKLPILEVDNWNLTPQYLEKVWDDWSKREWQWELLTEEYWINKIQTEHENLYLS